MQHTIPPRHAMNCPRCGTANHTDARFCIKCETPLGGGFDLPAAELVLANRTTRLLAKIIDLPFTMAGILVSTRVPPSMPGAEPVQLVLIMAGVIGMVAQASLLSADGQTIGKKLLGLKVVRVDNERNGGFVTNVLLRAGVNGLLAFTVVYFVVDVLFIFFKNRLCLHDYVAGTKVIKV